MFKNARANEGEQQIHVDLKHLIDLSGSPYLRSAEQKAMAKIIVDEFANEDMPIGLTMAAIANAAAESALNPLASGDNGNAIGLFQFNVNGAGAGMTVAQRSDPIFSTQMIIAEYNRSKRYTRQTNRPTGEVITTESLDAALENGASPARLAALFGLHVERPYDKNRAMRERPEILRGMFPDHADLDSRLLVFKPPFFVLDVTPFEEGNVWTWVIPIGLGLSFATVSILGALYLNRRAAKLDEAQSKLYFERMKGR